MLALLGAEIVMHVPLSSSEKRSLNALVAAYCMMNKERTSLSSKCPLAASFSATSLMAVRLSSLSLRKMVYRLSLDYSYSFYATYLFPCLRIQSFNELIRPSSLNFNISFSSRTMELNSATDATVCLQKMVNDSSAISGLIIFFLRLVTSCCRLSNYRSMSDVSRTKA